MALTPFPTAVLGAYLEAGHDQAVAGAMYGLAMTAMGATFGTLWAYVLWHEWRGLLRGGAVPRETASR